ncbi:hypothetical protein FJ953_26960 [Mesorhizobium sp. B2-3-6]|nr:hypothetical protein FJ953_26960 [Mesorhizobium sp. B2-3-6]
MGTLRRLRDDPFDLDETGVAPLLNDFGGKITTFRKLAERGLHRLERIFPQMGGDWTASIPLPGGNMPNADFEPFVNGLCETWPWSRAPSFIITGGSTARGQEVVGATAGMSDLGQHYGGLLYDSEARYLVARE